MFNENLQQYILSGALPLLNQWCKGFKIKLIIKNPRHTKLGDYRRGRDGSHQITLNIGMSKELTFFTLTHEIAHMHAREKFGQNIKPHGKEWKFVFSNFIRESIDVYPEEMKPLLLKFSNNPLASFYASKDLAGFFIEKEKTQQLLLKDIPNNSKFRIKGKIFKKGKLRKIRYLCEENATGKQYTIHMLAPVDEVIED